MRIALVLGIVGHLLAFFAAAFLPSLAFAAFDGGSKEMVGFAAGAGIALVAGLLLSRLRDPSARLSRAENLAVVSGTWFAVALFSAVPFLFVGLSFIDAFFESMSGITTTGATVLTDFSLYGRGVFLWRSVLHWIGGLGVIALFVAILPQLGVAGRQFFFAEASTASEGSLAPQVRRFAGKLWILYSGMTVVEIVLLIGSGMPWFDSLCNAMATLSAGGFSPNPAGIAGYANPRAEWVIAVFMFLAGTSFALPWRMLMGRPLAFLRDPEFRVYAVVTVIGTAGVAWLVLDEVTQGTAIRAAFFQVTSVMSATGFASVDFDLWTDGPRALLVGLMLLGGCAGSAAGGPKIVRYMIVAKHCRREMTRVVHPLAVLPVRLGRAVVSDDVLRAVVTFVVVYVATWGAVSFTLTLLGLDMVSAVTGTLACLANCGPGLSKLGPMESYAHLPDAAKSILILTMWLGRLEVVTVLALCRVDLLRHIRWRGQ